MKLSKITSYAYIIFLYYIVCLNRQPGKITNINIFPFKRIYFNFILRNHYDLETIISVTLEMIGNIIIFIYYPYFLYYTANISKKRSLLFKSITTSFFIEIIQLIFRIGKFDVNDLVMNTIGALIGIKILNLKTINSQTSYY